MIKKVTVQRVKGADTESLTLETRTIQRVASNRLPGKCIVVLKSGHRISVKGTVKEVRQTIREAKRNVNTGTQNG